EYEAPVTLEVAYTSDSGEKVHEIIFVDASVQPGMGGPRILVPASRVNTMNRAISVLTRKVDNLTTTLRMCRADYYKELFSLRYGREPEEEHEKYWFMPQAYQDTVSIQELRRRFGTEQEQERQSQSL
ncbi:olpB, partial [Symbiodinium sp. KB8]